MDYSKLTENERINALVYHNLTTQGVLPTNWYQLLQSILVIPGAAIAVELIDLYIADRLVKAGIVIPPELNMETIIPEYYTQLAPVLYLPLDYNQENLTRAIRIIRIIRGIIADRNSISLTEPIVNTQNIPIVVEIPKFIPNGLQIYQLGNEIAICGNKTYNLREQLKRLGGRYDGKIKCWKYPLNRTDEMFAFVQNNLQPVQTTQSTNIITTQTVVQPPVSVERIRELVRGGTPIYRRYDMPQNNFPEPDVVQAPYIPNIDRLPQSVRDAAKTPNERRRLEYEMLSRDCEELKVWNNNLELISREDPNVDVSRRVHRFPLNRGKIRYTGEVKPPDLAFVCFLNNWHFPPYGYYVKPLYDKVYEVDASYNI